MSLGSVFPALAWRDGARQGGDALAHRARWQAAGSAARIEGMRAGGGRLS